MRGRRGVVLLSVLWAVVLIGSITAGAVFLSRQGFFVTRNRMALAQARWSLGWCENLALARLERDSMYAGGSSDLSNGSWCRVRLSPVNGKFNLNTADSLALKRFFGRDSLVAAVLDWRDADDELHQDGCERACARALGIAKPANRTFLQPAELRQVRGFQLLADSSLGMITVVGDGRINPAFAPASVIASLPGIAPSLARRIEMTARQGRVTSLSGLAQVASPLEQSALEPWWTDLLARTTFERGALQLEMVAGSRLGPAIASERVTVMPSQSGAAVLMRESW